MAALTSFAQRLTPIEVAQHWFRRSRDYAREIHTEHPTFPKAGPDGLYLSEEVRSWFDGWHGRRQNFPNAESEEEQALDIAKYGKRRSAPSSL